MRDAAAFTVDDPRFSTAQVVGPSMLSLDGPAHTRHRDPFARPFRPARTRERFTAFVEAEAGRLAGGLAPAGRAELRGELAGPLAVAVVTEALGLYGVDAATVRSWYGAFVEAVSAITAGGTAPAGADEAYRLLGAAVEEAIGAARPGSLLAEAAHGAAAPDTGPLDTGPLDTGPLDTGPLDTGPLDTGPLDTGPLDTGPLDTGPLDTGPLDTVEVVANAAILMFGGIDTTEGMIANLALHLLGEPAQLRLVLDDRDLLPAAIEESLRLEPAASVVDRYATRDADLGGTRVRAGDLVRVSIAGANRDPAAFPDPDRFDVRRENAAEHLAFAHGPHFCFGSHLARLEARTALTALLDRLPGLRLD
ncbi:cytochrome P450, partial [Actinomadura sp. KC345]